MCCIMLMSLSVSLLSPLSAQSTCILCYMSFFYFYKVKCSRNLLKDDIKDMFFFFFSFTLNQEIPINVGNLEATFQRFAKFNIGPSCIYCRSLRNPPSLPPSLTGAGVHDKAFGLCRRLLIFRMSVSVVIHQADLLPQRGLALCLYRLNQNSLISQ